jgi:hypothetical protein
MIFLRELPLALFKSGLVSCNHDLHLLTKLATLDETSSVEGIIVAGQKDIDSRQWVDSH